MKRVALLLTKDELMFLSQFMDTVGNEIPVFHSDKHFDSIKASVDAVIVNAALWEHDNGNQN